MAMNSNDRIALHISLVQGVGPSVAAYLLAALGPHPLSDIYTFTQRDFVERCALTIKQAQLLEQGLRDHTMLEQECLLLEKYSIAWVTLLNDEYPALLKEIHVPPLGIYVQGELPYATRNALGVVGARKSHGYAQRVINACIPDLVAQGWTIVSGGALGADTMAHEATLKAGGNTVAVLGSGLLELYPGRNKDLFRRIVDSGGALISPFPLRAEPLPGNFPARNRIISGLSRGCLVVQAGDKSGATITAHCALEQGREVFAVPGHVDDPLSVGCHALLKQGAVLVRNATDILSEFDYSYATQVYTKEHQLQITAEDEAEAIPEDPVLAHCLAPASVDELIQKTGLSLGELYNRLTSLQLDGRIEQNYMGLWQKA